MPVSLKFPLYVLRMTKRFESCYLRNILHINRQKVHRVRQSFRGLWGSHVRVYQHRVDALLLQRLDGLRTAVIKLTGLAYTVHIYFVRVKDQFKKQKGNLYCIIPLC